MSVYKVPQDVEAEDKLVGPYTLKQFIFLIVAFISGYITFALLSINPILTILTIPLVLIFGILGVYRRPDQPVEIYLASLVRFYLKPRRRIWDQDGIMEPVHINTPPKNEHRFTDGRSRGQVVSQLNNLADMMDTRGWSAKNANLQVPGQVLSGDRLVGAQELPRINQPVEIHAADDMLDYSNNPVAQTMEQLAQGSVVTARQDAVQSMQQGTPVNPVAQHQSPAVATYPAGIQQKVIEPKQAAKQSTSSMTEEANPDIIRLSQNSDLNVSTLARQAGQPDQDLTDEGEISLR